MAKVKTEKTSYLVNGKRREFIKVITFNPDNGEFRAVLPPEMALALNKDSVSAVTLKEVEALWKVSIP